MPSRQNKRVLMPVYGYAPDDPRVVFEGRLVKELGYDILPIGIKTSESPFENSLNFQLLPLVNSYNPLKILRATWELLRGNINKTSSNTQSTTSNALSILFFNLWIIRIGISQKPVLIHCHEHQGLFGSWVLAKLRRCKLIYDVHESTMYNRSQSGIKGRLAIWIEQLFLRRTDAVITVGERLATLLSTKGARQVVVIGNWKISDQYSISDEQLQELRDNLTIPDNHLIISYIGALETNRDLIPLLEAIENCSDVHLIIAGKGSLSQIIAEKALHVPNIHWLGWISLDQVPQYTQLSDVIYCCINPILEQNDYVVPNKLFDAFAANKALIARKDIGEMAEILTRHPIAVILDEVNAKTIQAGFEKLKQSEFLVNLQNQAQFAQENYNEDVAKMRLNDLYDTLISDNH